MKTPETILVPGYGLLGRKVPWRQRVQVRSLTKAFQALPAMWIRVRKRARARLRIAVCFPQKVFEGLKSGRVQHLAGHLWVKVRTTFQALNDRIRRGITEHPTIIGTTGAILALVWTVSSLPGLAHQHVQARLMAEAADKLAYLPPTRGYSQPTQGHEVQLLDQPTQLALPEPPSPAELQNTVARLASKLESTINALETLTGEVAKLRDERDELAAKFRARAMADEATKGRAERAAYRRGRAAPNVRDDGMKVTYKVKPGDTLWGIARHHGVSVSELAAWNGVKPEDPLRPGRRLMIMPQAKALASVTPPFSADAAFTEKTGRLIRYTVRRGDTLYRISKRFDVSIANLRKWNELPQGGYLQPNLRLTVHLDAAQGPTLERALRYATANSPVDMPELLDSEHPQQLASLSYQGVERVPTGPDTGSRTSAYETMAEAERSGSEKPPETPKAGSQSAPGQFEVDEEAADRALERTLVQAGVLLLPVGQAEVEPGFAYTRREDDVPTFVNEDGLTFVGTENVRRNVLDADVQLRLGLPFDSQLELRFPYRYVNQSNVTRVGFNERGETDGSGHGFGDLRVGLAKTLLREGPWMADLVGRVAWDTDTGETRDNDVLLGNGFNEVIGTLNAVKRQDPLAFVGDLSYKKTFEKDDIKPGEEIGLSIGAVLAASPQTSLRFVLGQRFVNELEVDNESINGSDQVIGTLTLGASSIIGRRTLLDFSTGIGLTDEAPDYSLRLSFGTRFDMRTLF